MATLGTIIFHQYLLDNGTPNNAGKVGFYEPGGTYSVLKEIYSDAAGTPASNPMTCGADGRITFYAGDGAYDVALLDSDSNVLDTVDNYANAGSSGDSVQVVETIAAAKALQSGAYTYVDAAGNLAKGDGGGGRFFWNSTDTNADDGIDTLQPDSAPATGRLNRIDDFQINTLGQNMYIASGTDKYFTSDVATKYTQGSGEHNIKVVASGTANDTITWVEMLKVDIDAVYIPVDDKELFIGASNDAYIKWDTTKGNDSLAIGVANAEGDIYLETVSGVIYCQPNGQDVLQISGSQVTVNKLLAIADDVDISTGTSNGTVIAATSAMKLSVWGATPITQLLKASYNNWAAHGDIVNALVDFGLFDQA